MKRHWIHFTIDEEFSVVVPDDMTEEEVQQLVSFREDKILRNAVAVVTSNGAPDDITREEAMEEDQDDFRVSDDRKNLTDDRVDWIEGEDHNDGL